MLTTVFDSGGLPPAERLARFNEFQIRSQHPMGVTAEPAGFQARARALDLAAVNVVELTCSAAEIRRTPKLIRQTDPELYSLVMPLRGIVTLNQGERNAELGEREMALYTSSHPFQVRLGAGHDTTTLLRAHVPRTALPLPARKIDRLAAIRLPARSGVGAAFAEFLTRLTADADAFTPADVSRMSSVAADLLTAVLAHHLDTEPPAGTREAELLRRIKTYIQRHLHDPDLSPSSVAAAQHISVSYLHRLFQAQELTAAAWIRRRRLDRARRDLTDATYRDLPIHRIAARWGFTDHATFTRAFRAAYGIPPRDYRRTAHAPR